MVGLFLLGAAAYAADSKITMVTYFPTPYMAYQDVTVSGPCDMGLINDCRLNVAKDLQVDSMSVGQGAALTLKGHDAQADTLKSGPEGADDSRGSLVFEGNLTVGTLPGQVKALETEKGTLTGLNLGTKAFPTCNATGNKISWKNLTINNQAGVYLVCGEGSGGDSCEDNPNQEKCCEKTYPTCGTWSSGALGSKCVSKKCNINETLTTNCTCKKNEEDDGDL